LKEKKKSGWNAKDKKEWTIKHGSNVMTTGIKKHITRCAFIIGAAVCLWFQNSYAQSFGSDFGSSGLSSFIGAGSGATCNSSCSNKTCSLSLGSDGALQTKCPSGRRFDVDPNCIMNQNAQAGSCLDTMPVSAINRVSETNCYRANGAGGNPKPRNHLGTDYAANEGTTVTAAADGTVVYAKWMGGGGRVIIIEHEKKCQCTAGNANSGCDDKYISVYMHLKAFKVTGGTVKRGQPIGIVGGSNYSSASGTSCDWPEAVGSCKPYGPHLHFEIHSGPWSKGYASLKSSIINPLCDDIQNFCGGCSYDVQKCQGKTGSDQWESLSEAASVEKQAAAAVGSMTPDSQAEIEKFMRMFDVCPLENFLPGEEECWFCPIFRVLFNTASTVTVKAYGVLAGGVASVVIVAFALWLCLTVLKYISAMEVKEPRKMLQEIFRKAFKVFVVVLILKMSFFQVVGLTLEPVFNTGMTFAQTITGNGDGCPDSASYMQNIRGYDSSTGLTNSSSGGLPASMGKNIVCTIKSMQDSIGRMMGYGRQAMCLAWGPEAFWENFIPSFSLLFTGIVIYLGGLILLLAFPWCLIDCIIQLSIAAGLAPAAIGAWAFKPTSSYLKKVWDFFMNAMFNFVFLSIIIYIIMTVVDQFMLALVQRAANGVSFFKDPIDGLAYWGVTGMKLVVVCLIGWVFLDEGKNFANKFASGADLGNMGRKVGGTFAQGAKKVGKVAGKGGLAIAAAGGVVADHFIGSKLRKARDNYRRNKVMNKGNAILDADGNITGYERTRRNILGQKVTRRVTFGANGEALWSKEKHGVINELGNKARTAANNHRLKKMQEEGKAITDEEGNVIGYEMSHRNLLGEKVTLTAFKNEDGTFDIDKKKNSLRMEALRRISPAGSKVEQFAKEHETFKQKSLNYQNQASKTLKSDHLLSVREIKDKNGAVIQRDIQFKSHAVKHLVNADGTINTQMVEQIKASSKFDEQTLNEAIALEALKARGIPPSEKFDSRQTTIENGVMHLRQVNRDGSVFEMDMAMGGKNNNQMLTVIRRTETNGSYTVEKDNGIQKCTISHDVYTGQTTANYGFNDYYNRKYKYTRPLDIEGQFAPDIDADSAMFGFSDDDYSRHVTQIRTGKLQAFEGDYNPISNEAMDALAASKEAEEAAVRETETATREAEAAAREAEAATVRQAEAEARRAEAEAAAIQAEKEAEAARQAEAEAQKAESEAETRRAEAEAAAKKAKNKAIAAREAEAWAAGDAEAKEWALNKAKDEVDITDKARRKAYEEALDKLNVAREAEILAEDKAREAAKLDKIASLYPSKQTYIAADNADARADMAKFKAENAKIDREEAWEIEYNKRQEFFRTREKYRAAEKANYWSQKNVKSATLEAREAEEADREAKTRAEAARKAEAEARAAREAKSTAARETEAKATAARETAAEAARKAEAEAQAAREAEATAREAEAKARATREAEAAAREAATEADRKAAVNPDVRRDDPKSGEPNNSDQNK